jgi:hypothetical protein
VNYKFVIIAFCSEFLTIVLITTNFLDQLFSNISIFGTQMLIFLERLKICKEMPRLLFGGSSEFNVKLKGLALEPILKINNTLRINMFDF